MVIMDGNHHKPRIIGGGLQKKIYKKNGLKRAVFVQQRLETACTLSGTCGSHLSQKRGDRHDLIKSLRVGLQGTKAWPGL